MTPSQRREPMKRIEKQLLALGVAIGAAVAAWKGKPVIMNAKFTEPIRQASSNGSYVHNVQIKLGTGLHLMETGALLSEVSVVGGNGVEAS